MTKIAIHQPRASYVIGGAETISMEMSRWLATEYQVSFVTSKHEQTKEFKEFYKQYKNKIKFVFIDCPRKDEFPSSNEIDSLELESIAFTEQSRKFYQTNTFDIIAFHFYADVMGVEKKNTKFLLHDHGYPKKITHINKTSYEKFDNIISCSKFAKRKLLSFYPKLKNVDFFHMRPDLECEQSTITTKKRIDILYAGRLVERKGTLLLLEALSKIKKEFNTCKIVGNGPLRNEIKSAISDYNLSKKVKLRKATSKRDILKIMSSSKVFVHPALKREPFPTTILESMYQGTPVIATKVGGITEQIIDQKNGVLLKAITSTQLARCIKKLLEDEDKRASISIEGKKFIKEKFNKEEKIEKFIQKYEKILKNE